MRYLALLSLAACATGGTPPHSSTSSALNRLSTTGVRVERRPDSAKLEQEPPRAPPPESPYVGVGGAITGAVVVATLLYASAKGDRPLGSSPPRRASRGGRSGVRERLRRSLASRSATWQAVTFQF